MQVVTEAREPEPGLTSLVVPEDVQAVFPSVAGHRLAGGARSGALQAQSLLRTVAVP